MSRASGLVCHLPLYDAQGLPGAGAMVLTVDLYQPHAGFAMRRDEGSNGGTLDRISALLVEGG